MAKLRHIAIAAKDPDAMAEFYKKAFDFEGSARPMGRSPTAII
jgi:catechol 2,3-dioxygenase-like lactoylglutathione lyase family enzyme